MRMYEQQLAAMSNLSAAAANPAASLLAASYNPFGMMNAASQFGGLGGFGGLGAAAGAAGMAGLGGMSAADYQNALAAAMTTGFGGAGRCHRGNSVYESYSWEKVPLIVPLGGANPIHPIFHKLCLILPFHYDIQTSQMCLFRTEKTFHCAFCLFLGNAK